MKRYLQTTFAGLWYVSQVFNRAFGTYRLPIIGLAALSFMGGMLEGVGINSIIPLFSFVSHDAAPAGDLISTKISELFQYMYVPYNIKTLVLFITGLFILKALVLFYSTFLAAKITTAYELETRRSLVELTFGADWSYLSHQKVGHLDQLLTTSVISSSNLLNNVSLLMVSISSIIVYSLLVLNVSSWIALATAVFGIGMLFLVRPLFRMTRNISREVTVLYKDLAHSVGEVLIGMKPIKSMHLQKEASGRSFGYFERIRIANRKLSLYRNISSTIFQPISIVFVLAIFLFFYKTSTLNFGMFAVIVYSIGKVFSYIQLSQSQLHLLSALAPYTQSILDYTEDAAQHQERAGGTHPFAFTREIALQDVSFSYGSNNVPTIHGVTLSIRKGQTVGIVGPSGGGKTTFSDLLLGLLRPTHGEITIDGVSLDAFNMQDVRTHIGYVAQEIFLLNDTIENNIKFFNEDITYDEVVTAAKTANCLDFIKALPDGFNTIVGERGILLSVGQRQRIALARVLARKPAILVLDEATSSLDNESEMLIQKAIENLHGTVTVIAVAHRLSTVMNADRVVVIDKGTVLEEGSPSELLADKTSYFFNAYHQSPQN